MTSRFLARRLAATFTLSIPLAWGIAFGGCGSGEPDLEDACSWLAGANCYQSFYEDVKTTCAAPAGGSRTGAFGVRDTLDVCIIGGSDPGQVIFDPPLDVANLVPTAVTFKMLDGAGDECGAGSVDNDSFSITINPVEASDVGSGSGGAGGSSATTSSSASSTDAGGAGGAGGGGIGGAGGTGGAGGVGGATPAPFALGAGAAGGAGAELLVKGGTFSSTTDAGRETFDTVCPSGEAHHFSRYQLASETCSTAAIAPRAELILEPGNREKEGKVVFRVYYPPTPGAAEPVAVEYFSCAIPKALPLDSDGVQNNGETDVDCGGLLTTTRCDIDFKCNVNGDCMSNRCGPSNGLKVCRP